MQNAIPKSQYTNNADGCATCDRKWKKANELTDSHCHFCGQSNCKDCMKKTRKFF